MNLDRETLRLQRLDAMKALAEQREVIQSLTKALEVARGVEQRLAMMEQNAADAIRDYDKDQVQVGGPTPANATLCNAKPLHFTVGGPAEARPLHFTV